MNGTLMAVGSANEKRHRKLNRGVGGKDLEKGKVGPGGGTNYYLIYYMESLF